MTTKQLTIKNYLSKADMRYADYAEFNDLCKGDLTQMDVQFLTNRTLKIFYDISPKDVRNLKLDQVDLLINKVNSVLSHPESVFKNVIYMDGIAYGFFNMSEATAGELIDMDDCVKNSNYSGLTSIVYRKLIGKINPRGEYRIEPYTGFDDKFKDISLDIVEGYLGFFLKACQILNPTTLISFTQ